MFDFRDVHAASKAEQIRAFAVEQAIELCVGREMSHEAVLAGASMIDAFINFGIPREAISEAIEEGYREGRFEVKEAVEHWFSDVDLDDLFKSKGWIYRMGMGEK